MSHTNKQSDIVIAYGLIKNLFNYLAIVHQRISLLVKWICEKNKKKNQKTIFVLVYSYQKMLYSLHQHKNYNFSCLVEIIYSEY